MSDEHRIELESSFVDGGWTAECSCGWVGARQDTMREASADSAPHLRFVAEGNEAPERIDAVTSARIDVLEVIQGLRDDDARMHAETIATLTKVAATLERPERR